MNLITNTFSTYNVQLNDIQFTQHAFYRFKSSNIIVMYHFVSQKYKISYVKGTV
jgi:hypothetical protein